MGFVMEHAHQSLSAIGYITLFYVAYKVLSWIYNFFNMYFTGAAVRLESFGKWALVTGSTDGIGKGIAFELAKRGINIILVSRNPEKLKLVADEIANNFRVKTKYVAIDFSKSDDVIGDAVISSMYDAIAAAIEGLEVGILVNNVGICAMGEFLDSFSNSKENDRSTGIPKLIYCNDMSMSKVTAIILPQMIDRKKGLVINLSSMAATVVMPKASIYSGSKRFNDTLTKALSEEYRYNGIVFLSVQPGFVRTNMTSFKNMKVSLRYPAYETFAASLMKTVGKGIETQGCAPHALIHFLETLLPEWYMSKLLMKSTGNVLP